MNCCGTPTTIAIPADATPAERVALVQVLVSQCEFIEQGCGGGGPNDPGDPTPPTTQFYYSRARTASASCSSAYGGGTYVTTVSAGRFIAATQAAADALALAFITSQVTANRFCLNAPCLCPCADVATTLNINTVGGTGPFSFSIVSGTLPTGLTMTVVGGVLRVTGTPTVSGNSTITVEVYDSVGGTLTKNLTFYVIEITTSSPLPDYDTGVAYSQQLSVTGGIGPYAFSILDGDLPDGLTLSDTGLISGTPTGSGDADFTVVVVDTGLTGHEGCEKEFELDQSAALVTLGPGYAPAFSITSDIVHAGFAEPAPLTTGPISTRRVPEMTATQVLNLKLNGGSAWCPTNNKFYHGCAPASGDVMAIIIDPLTSATTPIGGFSTGGGVNCGRAFYHPTLLDIWLRFGNAGNGFARVAVGPNTISYIACSTPTDYTYCPTDDCIYFTDGGSIYKISNLGVVTTVFTEADFEALLGGPVSNWLIGAIEYVGGALDRIMWSLRYQNGATFYQQLWKTTPTTGATTFATIAGSSASPLEPWATIMWYSSDFDRLIVLQGVVTLAYDPADFTTHTAILTGHRLYNKGCYCDSVNKVALTTLQGGTFDLRFFDAASLG
jgi:hypothetical protein